MGAPRMLEKVFHQRFAFALLRRDEVEIPLTFLIQGVRILTTQELTIERKVSDRFLQVYGLLSTATLLKAGVRSS